MKQNIYENHINCIYNPKKGYNVAIKNNTKKLLQYSYFMDNSNMFVITILFDHTYKQDTKQEPIKYVLYNRQQQQGKRTL